MHQGILEQRENRYFSTNFFFFFWVSIEKQRKLH